LGEEDVKVLVPKPGRRIIIQQKLHLGGTVSRFLFQLAAARDRVVLVLLDGTGGDFPTPFANAVAVVQPESHAAILEQWNDPASVQAIVDLVMDSLPSVVKPDAVLEEPQARIFEKDFRFEAFSCGAR